MGQRRRKKSEVKKKNVKFDLPTPAADIVSGPLGEPAIKKVEDTEPTATLNTDTPVTFDNARPEEEIEKEQAAWKDVYRQTAQIQIAGESGLVEPYVDWWQIEPMHDSTGWMTSTPHSVSRINLDGISFTPWDSIPLRLQSENDIMRLVKDNTSQHGIRNHHPVIARIIARSLEEYPELQMAYYNS